VSYCLAGIIFGRGQIEFALFLAGQPASIIPKCYDEACRRVLEKLRNPSEVAGPGNGIDSSE
jgi:hypothetical protein